MKVSFLFLRILTLAASLSAIESHAAESDKKHPATLCARAVASDVIVNMNRMVREMGVSYRPLFDEALRGSCNREEIVEFLKSQPRFRLERSVDYSRYSIDYFEYRPQPFPLNLIGLGIGVNIMSQPDGVFLKSNWGITAP